MSSAADPHSILNRNPGLNGFQAPAPKKPKVTRYFRGKAPDWEKEDSDDDIFPIEHDLKSLGGTSITSEKLNQRLAMIEEKSNAVKPEERRVIRSEKIEKKPQKADIKEKTKDSKVEISNKNNSSTKELKVDASSVEVVGSGEVVDRRAAMKARLLAKEGKNTEGMVVEPTNNNHTEIGGKNSTQEPSTEVVKRNININEAADKKEMEIEEDEVEDIVEEYEEEEGGLINIMKPIYVRKDERSGINDKQVVGYIIFCFFLHSLFLIQS